MIALRTQTESSRKQKLTRSEQINHLRSRLSLVFRSGLIALSPVMTDKRIEIELVARSARVVRYTIEQSEVENPDDRMQIDRIESAQASERNDLDPISLPFFYIIISN